MRSSVVSSSSTAGFGVKRLLICLAVLVCVGTPVLAAISVGPAGSGMITFDTAPPAAQWSSILWAGTSGPGTSGAADTFALIDGRVQTNVASAINTALAAVAGNPPAQATTPARWASDSGAHYIFTRPTADNGELITPTNPVHLGDSIVVWATGLGRTSPAIDSGMPAPTDPLPSAVIQPSLQLGGVALDVQYAGLVPGSVGLYQINATVPRSVPLGLSIPLVIAQGGSSTTLDVRVVK